MFLFTKEGFKIKYVHIYYTDCVNAQPLASRNPVFEPMFRREYAAGPLLCFSPRSLSYLEVHCCHKAESGENHCRAGRSSITRAQAPNLATTKLELKATIESAFTNIYLYLK